MTVKRAFDVFVAALGLILLAPLLALLSLIIAVGLGRPVFFRQLRPGLKGRPFRLVKFRTMMSPRDAAGRQLSDEARLTTLGRLLRASSLDELPELWNVLRGDMSIVGPRPLLMEYLDLYTPFQARRHDVRPGITGWAQVNGRNALSWDRKFELDVWYVDNQSFLLDMRILLLTLVSVFRREGVSQPGRATVDRFRGSQGVE